jgi:hypothetical protein
MEKVLFGAEFTGVIIASRAQLTDSSKKQTWRTGEFDSLNKNFPVSVYKLDEKGKAMKDSANNTLVSKMTYQEIKEFRRIQQPDGTFKSTYNYFQILYVLVEGEIVKLKFKGSGRGNFFDYSKSLSRIGAKLYDVHTRFGTYIDKQSSKYSISFQFIGGKDGKPIPVGTPDDIREARLKVARSFQSSGKLLSAPKAPQLQESYEDVQYSDIPTPGYEEENPFN